MTTIKNMREYTQENYPEIIHLYSPTNDNRNNLNSKNVEWVCKHGHIWRQNISLVKSSIKTKTKGCPYCSNKKVLKGYNDLETKCPELAKMWSKNNHDLPSEIVFGLDKRRKWICKEGHEFESSVSEMYRKKIKTKSKGCPYCYGILPVIGINDFKTLEPDLSLEWDYEKNELKPEEVSHHSYKNIWWLCKEKGHSFERTPILRIKCPLCPVCLQEEKDSKFKNPYQPLVKAYPEIVNWWNDERDLYSLLERDSLIYYNFKCPERGHEIKRKIPEFNFNCSECKHEDNLLKNKRPELKDEYSKNNTLPFESLTAGMRKEVEWICKDNKHVFNMKISDRATDYRNGECPKCRDLRVLACHTNPELKKCYHPDNKEDFNTLWKNSEKKYWWFCIEKDCNNTFKRAMCSMTGKNATAKCPQCISRELTSRGERELYDKVKDRYATYEVISNDRKTLGGLELDIYIPDINVAIEYNGDYWHDETVHDDVADKHERKSKLCRDKNINLFIVWDSDYRVDPEKILAEIINLIENPNLPIPKKYTYSGGVRKNT